MTTEEVITIILISEYEGLDRGDSKRRKEQIRRKKKKKAMICLSRRDKRRQATRFQDVQTG